MPIPNAFAVVRMVYETGVYDLTTHDGLARYVDDSVIALNKQNRRWGHLKKRPDQTNIHGHAEDAALYKQDDGTAQAVDFVQGAGGSNPTPGWNPDTFVYSHADWLDPANHAGTVPVPQPPTTPTYPTYEALGGDAGGVKITQQLEADYIRAGRRGLDGSCGAWQQRVSYDFLTGICKTVEASIVKHRAEWCAALGIPVQ